MHLTPTKKQKVDLLKKAMAIRKRAEHVFELIDIGHYGKGFYVALTLSDGIETLIEEMNDYVPPADFATEINDH